VNVESDESVHHGSCPIVVRAVLSLWQQRAPWRSHSRDVFPEIMSGEGDRVLRVGVGGTGRGVVTTKSNVIQKECCGENRDGRWQWQDRNVVCVSPSRASATTDILMFNFRLSVSFANSSSATAHKGMPN
jgi:hypothetical protein